MSDRIQEPDTPCQCQGICPVAERLDRLEQKLDDLLQAWQTTKGLLAMIKWLAVVGSGMTAFWLTLRGK